MVTAKFFPARRAPDDFVIRARLFAGSLNFILADSLPRRVRQLINSLRLCLLTAGASKRLDAFLRTGRFRRHLAFSPIMPEGSNALRLRLLAAGAGYRLLARLRAGRGRRHYTIIPVMTKGFDGHRFAAEFLLANCAIDDFLIVTRRFAQCSFLVLTDSLPRRVRRLFDHFRPRRVTTGAGKRLHAFLRTGGRRGDSTLIPVVTERSDRLRLTADLLMAHRTIDDLLIGARLFTGRSLLVLANGLAGRVSRRGNRFRLGLVAAGAAQDFLPCHGAGRLLRDRLDPIMPERRIFVRSRVRCVAAVALRRFSPILGALRVII